MIIFNHGWTRIKIRPEGHKTMVWFEATIAGMQVCIDERNAGDDKYVEREIEIVKSLAAFANQSPESYCERSPQHLHLIDPNNNPNHNCTYCGKAFQ